MKSKSSRSVSLPAEAVFALFLVMLNIPASAPFRNIAQVSSANMQNSTADGSMAEGNAQRSRVLATRSVDVLPQQVIWKLEKLFHIVSSQPFTYEDKVIRITGEAPTGQSFSFPIISQGVLFFTIYVETAYFYAIDALNGKQLVTLQFERNRLSAPAVIGHTAFFGTKTGRVYAYDLDTRKTKWIVEQKGGSFSYSPPAVDDGVVYLCGANVGLLALATDSGAVRWIFKSDELLVGPAIKGDDLILFSLNGLLISLDKRTGKKKWETKIGRDFSAPAILDAQVFVLHQDGEIRAYALDDGSLKWKSKNEGGARTPLVLFNDSVFYGEQYGNIVVIDASNGLEKWRFKTKRPCKQPIIAGFTLYASCEDRTLYALDTQTGEEKWKWESKKTVPPPTLADGVIYFLGSDGLLTAMK